MAKEQSLDLKRKMRALKYERDMHDQTATAMRLGIAGDSLMGNALLESFLVHARLLIDFLYGRPKTGYDDIRAEDMLDPGEWERIRPEQTQLLKDTKHDADKFLAHLTTTRLDRSKEWDYPAIFKEIDAALDVFYGKVQTPQDGKKPVRDK